MTTGPCLSRCESLTALPHASGSVKSGARAPSFRAYSAAPEVTSCPMGRSKSRSRYGGSQLAPSAINSSICCCNGVFSGICIAIVFLLPFLLLTHRLLALPVLTEVRLLCRENRCLDSHQERGSRGCVCDRWLLKPKRNLLPYQTSGLRFVGAFAHLAMIPRRYPSQVDCLWSSTTVSIAA